MTVPPVSCTAREVTVCFADLVGFTRLGQQLAPHELSALAQRLEKLVSDICTAPLVLVKTVGDAAMIVSPEPLPLIEAALALVDLVESADSDLPQLHVGVAAGPALSRAGDWFGAPVNLASRITAIAAPGSVLAEAGIRNQIRDDFKWSFAGRRRLHGVHEPVALYRARRAAGTVRQP